MFTFQVWAANILPTVFINELQLLTLITSGDSPEWTVNSKWLQRVSTVIDMVTSLGFSTIVNVHYGQKGL